MFCCSFLISSIIMWQEVQFPTVYVSYYRSLNNEICSNIEYCEIQKCLMYVVMGYDLRLHVLVHVYSFDGIVTIIFSLN